jgi:hypothetical protein
MQVSTDIRRSDLIRFNLYLLPRTTANQIFVGLVAVGVFVYLLTTKRPASGDSISIAIAAVASLVAGVASLFAGFVISLLFILLTSTEKGGILGSHIYRLTPEGLHESTPVNVALQKWAAIQSVGKSPNFIFLRINSYLFHLIPRRSFDSQEEFESFWANVRKFRESAS